MLSQQMIPKDSLLNQWVTILGQTEVPFTYQLSCGLSAIGALLKRTIWVDQHSTPEWGWNVYPNQSVMLIGPSGIGKDTAINFTQRFLEKFPSLEILGGTTIENIYFRMVRLGKPAAAFLPAGELSAFFGGRDYQSGMVQDITDLLSTNEKKDVSTKTDLAITGPKIIQQPTLTMICGSTEEWLHKAMPDGALEGGFLGRFLIMVEKFGRKQIPLAKYQITSLQEKDQLKRCSDQWNQGVEGIIDRCKNIGEIVLLEDAVDAYTNWYYNRFNYFSKAVLPYANRSRDTVLRLAMLMAVSRNHLGWIEKEDINFATKILFEVGKQIDNVVLPSTTEGQCAKEIWASLPTLDTDLIKLFRKKYNLKTIEMAKEVLVRGGEMIKQGGKWVKS